MRPSSSCSESIASMRSRARLVTLEIWPSQVGVPRMTMSEARIFSLTAGHSSPSPSSELTPGRTFRSTRRTVSHSTSLSLRPASTSSASIPVFDRSGDLLSVPLSNRAFIEPLSACGRSWVQQNLDRVVLLLLEDLVSVRCLIERQSVGVEVLDPQWVTGAAQQRHDVLHPSLYVGLPHGELHLL